jgi:hypothetical protein
VHYAFEDVENFEPEMIVLNPRIDTIIAIYIKSNASVASQVLSNTQKLICDLFHTLTSLPYTKFSYFLTNYRPFGPWFCSFQPAPVTIVMCGGLPPSAAGILVNDSAKRGQVHLVLNSETPKPWLAALFQKRSNIAVSHRVHACRMRRLQEQKQILTA